MEGARVRVLFLHVAPSARATCDARAGMIQMCMCMSCDMYM